MNCGKHHTTCLSYACDLKGNLLLPREIKTEHGDTLCEFEKSQDISSVCIPKPMAALLMYAYLWLSTATLLFIFCSSGGVTVAAYSLSATNWRDERGQDGTNKERLGLV